MSSNSGEEGCADVVVNAKDSDSLEDREAQQPLDASGNRNNQSEDGDAEASDSKNYLTDTESGGSSCSDSHNTEDSTTTNPPATTADEDNNRSRSAETTDTDTDTVTCPICFLPPNKAATTAAAAAAAATATATAATATATAATATAFVHGPCKHALCVECMELVLNANASVERWPPPSAADAHLSAPTLGRCPICRSTLSLFDVVDSRTLQPLYPPDTESWRQRQRPIPPQCGRQTEEEDPSPKHEHEHEHDHPHEHEPHPVPVGQVANEMLASLRESMASSLTVSAPERRRREKHPLENAVYIPYRGRPGEFSFHWDWEKVRSFDANENKSDNGNGNDNDDNARTRRIRRPFLNLTLAIRGRPEFWRLEDGTFAPRIKFLEEGCHFHEASRTFHGTVTWPVPLRGSYEWDIILGFSKDYRCISTGRIHHKRGRALLPGDVPPASYGYGHNSYTHEERELCKHPMDGRWTVVWDTTTTTTTTTTATREGGGRRSYSEIRVSNSEFRQGGWPFYFNFSDPTHIFVQWPRSPHRQIIVEGVDLATHPKGPPVGHRIKWETTDPNAPDLVWIRQTIGPVPTEEVHHYGSGEDKFFYHRLDAGLQNTGIIPKYNGDSVWGNVFTKRMCIGSASYHFVSPTESYISYRHPACRDLPPMDDGSPLPERVNFRNVEYDDETRKLTATIEWERDFGTSWNDNVRWKLSMRFDTEFMIILRGGVGVEWCRERRARPQPPRPPPRHRPEPVPVYVPPPSPEQEEQQQQPEVPEQERNEEWVVSGYGHDQLYVNAASLERYRTDRRRRRDSGGGSDSGGDSGTDGTEAEDDADNDEVDYEALAEQHRKRLEEEGATKRSIGFLLHLFELAAHDPNTNPIDFLL
eukprot:jgi/Psemu1/34813/gm1.34813_g